MIIWPNCDYLNISYTHIYVYDSEFILKQVVKV